MRASKPRYSKEEFAARGDAIYPHLAAVRLKEADQGKAIVIDIDTEDFEIDVDELTASDRLLSRHPQAQIWVQRIGERYARHFGASRWRRES